MFTTGGRVKELRLLIPDLTQDKLAKLAGLNKSTVNAIETGKREPDTKTLEKLLRHLNVTKLQFYSPLSVTPEVSRAPSPAEISQAVREVFLDVIEDLHTALFRRTKAGRQATGTRPDRPDRPAIP